MNFHLVRLSVLLCWMPLLLVGCGIKGPVQPLAQSRPSAATELTLQQQGEGLLLRWRLPQSNQDGSPLTDLAGFRIYRTAFDLEQDCPDCRQDWPLWRRVELDYLQSAQLRRGELYLLDRDLDTRQSYSYRVIPFNRWGQDGPAVEARQDLLPPPPAPFGLQARRGEDRLTLSWEEPKLGDGVERLGYRIYRRRPGQVFPTAPLNPTLLTQPFFEDRDFDKSARSYVYGVRLLVRQQDRVLESDLSTPLVVTAPTGF